MENRAAPGSGSGSLAARTVWVGDLGPYMCKDDEMFIACSAGVRGGLRGRFRGVLRSLDLLASRCFRARMHLSAGVFISCRMPLAREEAG